MVRATWITAMLLGASALASAEEARRYEVRVEAHELEVDSRGTVALEVIPQSGFSIDRKYPATFHFVPEVGDEVLVVAKSEQGAADARYAEDGSSLRWEVSVIPRRAGRHPAKLKAKFRVCKENDCTLGETELRIAIVAKGS
jgi:hypothetical protein